MYRWDSIVKAGLGKKEESLSNSWGWVSGVSSLGGLKKSLSSIGNTLRINANSPEEKTEQTYDQNREKKLKLINRINSNICYQRIIYDSESSVAEDNFTKEFEKKTTVVSKA
jgi:hypothetical protein